MTEYEPEAEVMTALASLRGISQADWLGGPVEDLIHRLHYVRALKVLCAQLASELEETAVSLMEGEKMVVAGLGPVQKQESSRSTWADDSASARMRDDLANAVAKQVSLDIATGEIDPMKKNVAMHTMRTAYKAIPSFSSLKQAARSELGLRLGDYRRFDTAYRIVIDAEEGPLT